MWLKVARRILVVPGAVTCVMPRGPNSSTGGYTRSRVPSEAGDGAIRMPGGASRML